MVNINGEGQGSFRWMLACVTIGIAVIVSPCFAAADLGTSQKTQRLGSTLPEIMPFKCDSLDPTVCFDIYWRLHNEPAPPNPRSSVSSTAPELELRPKLEHKIRGSTL
jgi:hypothetical protein